METTTNTKNTITPSGKANSQLQICLFWHSHHQWASACMLCSLKSVPVEVICCCCCWYAPPTTSVFSHLSFGVHKCSPNTDECLWEPFFFFSVWRNSVPYAYFIYASMSDMDCRSAAICHGATKYNGVLWGAFIFYCHTTNICPWHHGPT